MALLSKEANNKIDKVMAINEMRTYLVFVQGVSEEMDKSQKLIISHIC